MSDNGRSTATDRVWAKLAEPWQPTRLEFAEPYHRGDEMRAVPIGDPVSLAYSITPRDQLALLCVARIIDTTWVDSVTCAQVAEMMGSSEALAGKSLSALVKAEWLDVWTIDRRPLRHYGIIGV